jgi:lipopolysaccharide/colanic/teichoic acid biosynthesis glycosyltransferase
MTHTYTQDRRSRAIPGEYVVKRSGRDRRRTFNMFVAIMGLCITIIPMLLIALLIRITTGGPALYVQTRVGRKGKLFKIYKFRTMYSVNSAQVWATENDSRITPIGKFLRKTRLDELPQFVNVVLGNMNVVGPRPEQPEIAQQLRKLIKGYGKRTEVLPGITGLAQITLPPDQTIEDVQKKLELDKQYIANQSILNDFWIMMKTPIVMFGRKKK